MKKKKIRYSELTPGTPMPAVPAPAGDAALAPEGPRRPAAPVELARALAAARAAEAAKAVPAPTPAAALASAEAMAVALATASPARAVSVRTSGPIAAAQALRERARSRLGKVEVLVFRVANERFGVELAAVEEAIDLPDVHHVPEMPPAMLGVITVRGALTSVFSPQTVLGLSLTMGESALIFRRGRSRYAVVIDDVDDVMSVDLSHLREAPGLAGDGVLLGVLRHRDSLLALLDTEALLAACQSVPLLETA